MGGGPGDDTQRSTRCYRRLEQCACVHMGGALTDELRSPVMFERSELEFYWNGGDPHNEADEGFVHEG